MRLLLRPTADTLAPLLERAAAAELPTPSAPAERLLDGAAPPAGHHVLTAASDLQGREAFARGAEALLHWELHRAAGMTLAADAPEAVEGATIVNAGPFGPVSVLAPCRVVAVLDEPDRRGFVYRALAGNPVAGDELFCVERDGHGARFRLRSFSRPAGLPALAPPLARAAQQVVNRRYAAAARRLVA